MLSKQLSISDSLFGSESQSITADSFNASLRLCNVVSELLFGPTVVKLDCDPAYGGEWDR
jgi:hypothetical protein